MRDIVVTLYNYRYDSSKSGIQILQLFPFFCAEPLYCTLDPSLEKASVRPFLFRTNLILTSSPNSLTPFLLHLSYVCCAVCIYVFSEREKASFVWPPLFIQSLFAKQLFCSYTKAFSHKKYAHPVGTKLICYTVQYK